VAAEHGDRAELQELARRQGARVLSRPPCEEGQVRAWLAGWLAAPPAESSAR
jgi:predicted RNase H-like nuclease (RuvC/YqgF family)